MGLATDLNIWTHALIWFRPLTCELGCSSLLGMAWLLSDFSSLYKGTSIAFETSGNWKLSNCGVKSATHIPFISASYTQTVDCADSCNFRKHSLHRRYPLFSSIGFLDWHKNKSSPRPFHFKFHISLKFFFHVSSSMKIFMNQLSWKLSRFISYGLENCRYFWPVFVRIELVPLIK